MRLIDFFDRSAELTPDAIFVQQGELRRSYRDTQAMSHQIAAALARDGMTPGTRVGVYMPNDWRGLTAMLGLYRAGCVMVPVNVRNAVQQNAQILADADVKALFYHSSFAEDVAEVRTAYPAIKLTICIDDAGETPLSDWMAPEGVIAPEVPHRPEDLWTLYSTSGTTGRSKGVHHTHLTNLITSMDMLHALQIRGPVRHLVVAPMTHFAGTFIFALTVTGGTHILMDSAEPADILGAIERERAQILFLPPTLIYRMLADPDLPNHDYSSLHRFVYAAAPMAPEKLREAIAAFGPVMSNFYGQTEALGPISFLPPEDHRPQDAAPWDQRLMSIGQPSILRGRVPLRKNDSRGFLCSWLIFQALCSPINPVWFSWYLTGDIGVADAEGYVTLVDRKKDMIISGGFNIYPAEIERELLSHPDVLEAAVIGVPDPDWGEAVKAIVELRDGGSVTDSELIDLCKSRLGSMRAPKTVDFIDELPRNATGKVLKRTLRAPYWEGRQRGI